MHKKQYFVLSPASSTERTEELSGKAASYYGTKDYEPSSTNSDLQKLLQDFLKELDHADCNSNLLLLGMTLVAMSKCDSIYVAADWQSDDVCKFAHMVAFSHGIDIIHEPV